MLLMLLQEQLDKYWPYIKYVIQESFPPRIVQDKALLNNILESLLLGKMQAWVLVRDEDTIIGLMLTSTADDSAIGKILRIYCLYGFENFDDSVWLNGWETLRIYAESIGCAQIEAFTQHKMIAEKAATFGWQAEIHLYKEI